MQVGLVDVLLRLLLALPVNLEAVRAAGELGLAGITDRQ